MLQNNEKTAEVLKAEKIVEQAKAMCALRGVLQTAIACRGQSKGNTAFSLRCRGRTYPFAYFAFSEAPKSGAALPTKSADTAQSTVSVCHSLCRRVRCGYGS